MNRANLRRTSLLTASRSGAACCSSRWISSACACTCCCAASSSARSLRISASGSGSWAARFPSPTLASSFIGRSARRTLEVHHREGDVVLLRGVLPGSVQPAGERGGGLIERHAGRVREELGEPLEAQLLLVGQVQLAHAVGEDQDAVAFRDG